MYYTNYGHTNHNVDTCKIKKQDELMQVVIEVIAYHNKPLNFSSIHLTFVVHEGTN